MQQTSSGFLDVGDGHQLWFETRGDPAGEPVLVFHGGPGSGCSLRLMDLCDPARHFVVGFDQRGAGRSVPAGSLRANTTAHLIADAERLGLSKGDEVAVKSGDTEVTAFVAIRAALPEGTCFLMEGTQQGNANVFANGKPAVVEIGKASPKLEVLAGNGNGGE